MHEGSYFNPAPPGEWHNIESRDSNAQTCLLEDYFWKERLCTAMFSEGKARQLGAFFFEGTLVWCFAMQTPRTTTHFGGEVLQTRHTQNLSSQNKAHLGFKTLPNAKVGTLAAFEPSTR